MNASYTNILRAFAFALVVLAWIFGLRVDLTGDAGLYAAISRQMVASGNWLELKLNGVPYDQKPHLFFWLAGLGIELLGHTNVAFKLFPFLFGVLGIYFTYRLARMLFSRTAGQLAALFTGTSQIYFLYFFDIHTDTVLQSAVTLALWQLAAYLKYSHRRYFIGGFAGVGLAMLTKGPVGAVVPFFFVLFFLVLNKDYRRLFHPKWLAGIFLVLVIISPALFHLWTHFGVKGLRFYFIDNNIGRVSGRVAGSSTDPFFYLYNLLWAFLPWTVPVVAGVFLEVRSWFNPKGVTRSAAALLGSVMVLFVVFSIARGKAPNYLMLLVPPLAVVAAGRIQHVEQWPPKQKKLLAVAHLFVIAVLLMLLIILEVIVQGKDWGLLLGFVLLTGLVLPLFGKLEKTRCRQYLFSSVVIIGVLNLFLNASVLPALFNYQGARQALRLFRENRTEKGILKNLQLEEYELFYWADDPVQEFSSWNDFYAFLEKEEPWVYTNETGLKVVKDLKVNADTIFIIPQRGMNELTLPFLNPATRKDNLQNNYLIKVK